MIVVRVELHSAITGKVSEIGRMTIANDGTALDSRRGNYDAVLYRKPDFIVPTRTARLGEWPRLSKTVWHLVARLLATMGYDK